MSGGEEMKKKNYSIEFYRIIATLVICIHHMQNKVGLELFTHGELFVDFFFIISGMFLAVTYNKEKVHSGSKYFIRRLKRLYPEYILAAFVAIVSYSFVGKFSISKALPELFMVQNLGMFEGGYNYPCWYLSTLIFASFIIYEFLKYKEDLYVRIIAPLLVVGGYGYIVNNLSHDFIWSSSGCVYVPLLRCVCGMTLGVFVFYLSKCDFVKNINKVIGTIIEIACIAVVGVGITTEVFSPAIIVATFAVIVFITNNQCGLLGKKVLNFKGFSYVSKYSYSVYLNHGILANTMDILNRSVFHIGKSYIVIYLAAVIVYSVITHHVITFIMNKISNKKTENKA